jgi:hypothetical protein
MCDVVCCYKQEIERIVAPRGVLVRVLLCFSEITKGCPLECQEKEEPRQNCLDNQGNH